MRASCCLISNRQEQASVSQRSDAVGEAEVKRMFPLMIRARMARSSAGFSESYEIRGHAGRPISIGKVVSE